MVGGPLAHQVEQGTFNPKVRGSRPRRPTKKVLDDGHLLCILFSALRFLRHFCATLASTLGLDGLVQPTSQRFIQCREQVPVGAKGHLDRRMAQPLHDCLRVSTLGDEQGGVGVPQVVVAQPWG